MNLRRVGKILDLDYLIDEVFKKQEPLDIQKLYNSKIEVYVPATRSKDGEIIYFKNDGKHDFFEVMRATEAVPFATGLNRIKKVRIGEDKFFDSRATSRPMLNIQQAVSHGADKIVIFDNYFKWNSIMSGKFVNTLWLMTRPKAFRKKHLKMLRDEDKLKLTEKVSIFYISPKKKLHLAVWSNNCNKLERVFNQGFMDVLDVEDELREFIGKE